MGATFSRLKNWVAEILTYADLNAEIDNILTNLTPSGMDDYSTNAAQMQVQTDPGSVGAESLATSLAGELTRLRFVIARLTGETYWYSAPDTSMAELATALGGGLSANRLASGRSVSGTSQPIFLVPHGTNRTVSVKGATTPFIYYINGVQYTISTDVTSGTLTAAPSSNNTTLVNNTSLTGSAEFSKVAGEYDFGLDVDAMGSEITALVGKMAAFKVGAEYFLAKVESTTRLTKLQRGFFFDSADAALPRVVINDNDTITLMKLTWIFAKTDGTLTITYNNPVVSLDQPTSPSIGDYWYDMSTNLWKTTIDGSSYNDATAILIGVCCQDTSGTKAARGFDFFKNYDELNTVELERISNTEVRSKRIRSNINVYGSIVRYQVDHARWDITVDLDSGVTESASKTYYCYIKENGDEVISDVAPMIRDEDLRGRYHTHQAWRCVGEFFNDGSSNILTVESYGTGTQLHQSVEEPRVQGRLTLATATPVTTTDQTAKTTVYFTPYKGNRISFWNGSQWITKIFREASLTVPASTAQMYDVFGTILGSTIVIESLAWTNDTTRATALTAQGGLYVQTGATHKIYLGSYRTTGVSGQTEDSVTKRYVWNYYNRIMREVYRHDDTNNWNYTTGSYQQANNSTANQVEYVCGVIEDQVNINVLALATSSGATARKAYPGIGINSVTANSAKIASLGYVTNSVVVPLMANYCSYPSLGYQYFAWLERGSGSDTQTWYGDDGVAAQKTGIFGHVIG